MSTATRPERARPAENRRSFVTIAMPALNEERHIAHAIASVTPETDAFDYEILVLDGGSTDGTRRIVERLARADDRIRLVHNERRTQSAALNKAAAIADPRSEYLIRADCHADYPPGFVERCVADLSKRGIASVVVPMRTVGQTCFQKAVAAAQNSRLGNGGSAHRRARAASRYVEHGHHAGFCRKTFRAVGGYDESFTHNEDAEFDVRLRRSGAQIWLNADAAIGYFPRATVRALARQYYNHGRGRARTLLKHRMRPRLRQLLPPAAVLFGLLGLALGLLDWHFLLVPALYVSGALLAGAVLAVERAVPCALASGFAALVMHASWAAGFLGQIVSGSLAPRRTPRSALTDPASAPPRSLS